MKLTDDQINTIFDNADSKRDEVQQDIDGTGGTRPSSDDRYGKEDLPARRAMVESIIEGYQALEPAPAVRWIPAANRKPSPKDFDIFEKILVLEVGVVGAVDRHTNATHGSNDYHWMRLEDLKLIPKEPVNAEVVEEKEFMEWWEVQFVPSGHVHDQAYDVARAAWKAARNK